MNQAYEHETPIVLLFAGLPRIERRSSRSSDVGADWTTLGRVLQRIGLGLALVCCLEQLLVRRTDVHVSRCAQAPRLRKIRWMREVQ